MGIIAVAGGTGGVGRTIVEAIKAADKHKVIILARKPNPELEKTLGVPVIAVDYFDVAAVAKTLEDNNVDTVVSTITSMPLDGTIPAEPQLIQAADASKTTKRMISSDWGVPMDDATIDLFVSAQRKRDAMREAAKVKDLKVSVVVNGYFLDYWVYPKIQSNLQQLLLIADIPNNTAAVPGSGDVPVVFTHTTDVARFVAASMDLEEWDPIMYVIGSRATWNEFVKLAEEAKGVKFNIVHDSVEKMKGGEVTELPSQIAVYDYVPKAIIQHLSSLFGVMFENGVFDLHPKRSLNDIFPDIKTKTVAGALKEAWGSN